MAGNKPSTYTDSAGKTFDLSTSDGISRAVADLGARVGTVESKTGSEDANSGGDTAARLSRLENVCGTFFRGEFDDYDADARNAAASKIDAATGA